MMGRWKTCFKLLKYSHHFKRSIWGASFLFLMGLGLFVGVVRGDIRFVMISIPVIFLSLTMVLQLKEDFMFLAMVCASPQRRFLDTLFSDVLLISPGVVAYLIYVAMVLLFLKGGDVEGVSTANVLLISGLTIAIFIVFIPMCLKWYWRGLICSLLLYMLLEHYIDKMADAGKTLISESTPIGFLLGLGTVLAGGAISVVIRRILYKKPLSKWAVRVNMQKIV